jgi:hypothetical protein
MQIRVWEGCGNKKATPEVLLSVWVEDNPEVFRETDDLFSESFRSMQALFKILLLGNQPFYIFPAFLFFDS